MTRVSRKGTASRPLRLRPHMWETSKRLPWARQFRVESMMESAYWIGMDQPAKGTIFPPLATCKSNNGVFFREAESVAKCRERRRVTDRRRPPPLIVATRVYVRVCGEWLETRETARSGCDNGDEIYLFDRGWCLLVVFFFLR